MRRGSWNTAVRRQISDLGHLESWLGDDHNLVVLRTHIDNGHGVNRQPTSATRVTQLANRRQHDLRRRALALATSVFDDSPKKFAKRFQQL